MSTENLSESLFKDWVPTSEAAKMLECTTANIWKMIERGKLPNCVKTGGIVMIPISDIENIKEERRIKKENRLKPKFVVPSRDDILRVAENKIE